MYNWHWTVSFCYTSTANKCRDDLKWWHQFGKYDTFQLRCSKSNAYTKENKDIWIKLQNACSMYVLPLESAATTPKENWSNTVSQTLGRIISTLIISVGFAVIFMWLTETVVDSLFIYPGNLVNYVMYIILSIKTGSNRNYQSISSPL